MLREVKDFNCVMAEIDKWIGTLYKKGITEKEERRWDTM